MKPLSLTSEFISQETREKWQYLAHFELFFADTDDEFNVRGEEEIHSFIEGEKTKLESCGIHIECRNEGEDTIITLKTQQDSEATWQHLEQILTLLQRRFLCSFRDYYVKENIDPELRKRLEATVPILTEGTAVSRRLIYQQSLATRWRLRKHLEHLDVMECALTMSETPLLDDRERHVGALQAQRDAVRTTLEKLEAELPKLQLDTQIVAASTYAETPKYMVSQGRKEESRENPEIVDEYHCEKLGKTFFKRAGKDFYVDENGTKVGNFVTTREGEDLVVVSLRTQRITIFQKVQPWMEDEVYEIGTLVSLPVGHDGDDRRSVLFNKYLGPIIQEGSIVYLENPKEKIHLVTMGKWTFMQVRTASSGAIPPKYRFVDINTGNTTSVKTHLDVNSPIVEIDSPIRIQNNLFESVGTLAGSYFLIPESYNETDGTWRALRNAGNKKFLCNIEVPQEGKRFLVGIYREDNGQRKGQMYDSLTYDEIRGTFQPVFVITPKGKKFGITYLSIYENGRTLLAIYESDNGWVESKKKIHVSMDTYDLQTGTFTAEERTLRSGLRRLIGRKKK